MRVPARHNLPRIALASSIALLACGHDESTSAARGPAGSPSSGARRTTAEAGGEVAPDSARLIVRWLDDANVVALVSAMNAKQLAAADAELSSWHLDTVRAFAAEMAREHAALQHSIDSGAAVLQIAPVKPALGALVQLRMQGQIDSMYEHGGRAFDRAYVEQQVASHRLMYLYLARLSAVTVDPGLQQVLSVVSDTVKSQLARAMAMRAMLASADSAAADSAARRAARRAARLGRNGGTGQ